MKSFKNIVLMILLLLGWGLIPSPGFSEEKAPQKLSWVAVHDFSVTDALKKAGLNGWRVAEKLENELVQRGRYRIVTRAKIAKVLKEKNIASSGSLEPAKFGAMVGAEFIVTGQVDQNGEQLMVIAKLIDATSETGEIEKSFDVIVYSTGKETPLGSLPTALEELARKLSMTNGEFFDHGIAMMKQGNYTKAVESFQELKRMAPLVEIKKLLAAGEKAGPIPNNLKTPGELFDYGMLMMRQGKSGEATAAFRRIETQAPLAEIRNLLEVGKMLKHAENKAQEQQADLQKAMTIAADLFVKAREAQARVESQLPPEQLCDKALARLEAILIDPKIHLSRKNRTKIENMISRIKDFRKNLFAGPSTGKNWTVPGLELRFVPIKSGNFQMGDPKAFEDADNRVCEITISKPFWISRTEVKIGQFLYYLQHPNNNPDEPSKVDKDKQINWISDWCPITKDYRMKRGRGITWGDKNQPIVGVSWNAAEMFCRWLTKREQKAKRLPAGYEYRLPTEAEWEYCCRAGSKGPFSFGNKDLLDGYAWFRDNSSRTTHPVGKKKANAWGLQDINGNVWEWCYDWYDSPYLGDATDPIGPDASPDNLKVLRGGSFVSSVSDLKSATRYSFNYKGSKKNIGFRVVCGPQL